MRRSGPQGACSASWPCRATSAAASIRSWSPTSSPATCARRPVRTRRRSATGIERTIACCPGATTLSRSRASSSQPSRCLTSLPRAASSSTRRRSSSTSPIRAADPAEVAELRRNGMAELVMLPLVATGNAIGLVELLGAGPMQHDPASLDLVRAMANEAAVVLENARLYEAARNLADRDPLTNFLNHRSFHERLGEELLRAQRGRRPVALAMMDLDGFKLVNDTRGHQVGDQV